MCNDTFSETRVGKPKQTYSENGVNYFINGFYAPMRNKYYSLDALRDRNWELQDEFDRTMYKQDVSRRQILSRKKSHC